MTLDPFQLVGKTIVEAYHDKDFFNDSTLILRFSDGTEATIECTAESEGKVEMTIETELWGSSK